MKRKVLRILLALCMVLCLAPMAAFAEDGSVSAPAERSSIALGSGGIQTNDEVYFGVYTENGVSYDVPWYVFDANGLLLCKYTLGASYYHDSWYQFYDGSILQGVMNGFYNGATTLFTDSERSAIRSTLLSAESLYKNNGTLVTVQDMTAYVFPLVFEDDEGFYKNNPLMVAPSITEPEGEGRRWWLLTKLSPGSCLFFDEIGVLYYNATLDPEIHEVRPTFNLDLSSVLFTAADVGGKTDAAADGSLTAVSAYTGSQWKLTLKDAGRNNFSANANGQTSVFALAGSSLQITYSGAKTGNNEYVSVLLCDSDDTVLYYGNIAQNSAGGTAAFSIPSELAPGSYTLKVFSEQCNGDKKTDYASAFQNIALKVLSQETTPDAVFTAAGDNGGTLSGVDTSMKYSVDGGANWNAITGETMEITGVTAANDVKVYKMGDGTTTADSEVQTIDIAQAAQPTGIGKIDCATPEQNNGQITGVDTTMEYKLSTDSEWTAISSNSVTGLADGTYEVRAKASGTVLASAAATVTIGAHTCAAQGHWQHSAASHWKLCTCSAKVAEAAHLGGAATCTDKAVCEVCGAEYGDLNPGHHAGLKHVDAKAATRDAKGNTEYWHCGGCGKYFADKDAAEEITKADTVTAKLPEEKPASPATGDAGTAALWITLLLAGSAAAAAVLCGRKRQRSAK